ncbi:hypothetical protein PHYBLDRAFT_64428 [Phycomyces blakesleeanus NRRL 1555(-)]|uniref:C2H2-type zinc finger transcription factor n=1 Tax=Phycomyces blakesleeanus (strain ATCC 8743b / DSM 1359 / FGSC 10004 / NBRC 33097 / NRRL 1555) TaxID=763407 RepID=A0A162UDU8_PHYB8|nr:hypothetical protein PHYBLDRAFT_64428 [Phycomyces blakesleeanus NRRL 1555(-)]OAD75512.1 hypothetical protein PHYBLDRAFT_64428 [Phycomyces blakesleeanus NRRL 1555(-)]|eukprot:XP_018293552.1 hypothetical protein PHYBLDRAFT_64428 [Phycomyces blakesleeanus NRRL 1555(-)]
MSSTSELYNKKCYCTKCSNNQQGYSFVSTQTLQHHNKRARYEDMERSERNISVQRNLMDIDFETMCSQTNSPVWEGAAISDNEVAFSNESNGESSDGDENDNDKENSFATPNMPENLVHRFIATFVIMFASHYVVNKGADVLIEFINKLLSIYEQDFQLPVRLSGPQSMTGFSAMTKGIKRFVVCQDCHKVYEESVPAPLNCDFIKLGAHTACNCKLMVQSLSGGLVAKKSYVYQSLTHALKILFLYPNFEQKIMHWNQEFKITDTLCDVYNGEAWTDLKDNDNEFFVEHPRSLMLTLNIDWFQPFNGTSYSCGAIYLVINNLPRSGQFKAENTILVGLVVVVEVEEVFKRKK